MKSFLRELKDYRNEELQRKIIELQNELSKLKQTKKYGLVWEEKLEIFDKESQNKLPVLEEVTQNHLIESDSESHILIEWDNYHTLSVLNYTHKGKIDVIYIDPPYNREKWDLVYNDKIVDKEDKFRHSKWLSFMNKRLLLARNLLSENGVIFMSIDDNELYQLKLLCDDIFKEENFIGTIIHQRAKWWGQAKQIVKWHDYILVYFKNASESKITLRRKKIIQWEIIIKDGKEYLKNDDFLRKTFWKYDKNLNDRRCFYEEIVEYKWEDKKNEIDEKIKKGELFLEKNHLNLHTIYSLELLDDASSKLYSIIKELSENWKNELENLGITGFDYPKPLKLIEQLILSVIQNQKNSTILDFFAGSGTTGHAVLELNREDGGNRKFILATNNENNICEEVTYQRVKKVMQGYTNKKWEKIEWLGGNLRYLKTAFIDKVQGNDDLRKRMVARCSELLCLKENIWNQRKISHEYIALFERNDRYLAILYDMFYFEDFLQELQKLEKPISVYCFSYYPLSQEDFEIIKQDISIEQIPDPILQVYESIFWL